MRGFGFVPDWGSSNPAPSRTNDQAYFPVSLSATVREATFSETLSGILDADPNYSLDDLETELRDLPTLADKDETSTEVWEAFKAGYTTSSGGYSSTSQKQDYLIPFHRAVAVALKVDGRQWWKLYWLLMTDASGDVAIELHTELVDALYDLEPSNLLEELIINAINNLEDIDTSEHSGHDSVNKTYRSIPPLVPDCAEAFREDLDAWLELRQYESASRWMRGLRDIICYHYMMYVIQVAIALDSEYEAIENNQMDDIDFSLEPVYFGLANESASQSRKFASTWTDGGLSRAMYDSWGRLAVLKHLVEVGMDEDTPVDNKPYTLSEALEEFPDELQKKAVTRLLDEFPDEQRPEGDFDLADAAIKFSHSVRRYYENQNKTRSGQTAWSAGENSVIDLGKGAERQFIERRQRVGTILRLDRAGLRLFARLFDTTRERGHIDEFWNYLEKRGIRFDHRSQQELIDQLEGMGLLQKQSDSGEAMYVDSI